jgi:PKD repeat protein
MSPSFKSSLLCLAGLAASCGGDGDDISAPPERNVPPIASFGSSCVALACTFSDSSGDADGRIVAYRWSFGDGSRSETARDAEHTYTAPNTYAVALTVTDDDGATDSVASTIHAILPPDVMPVAYFGSVCVDLTCAFSDSSIDPDGTVVSRHWDFGDSQTSDVPSPGHTYAAAGVYRAELDVTDDRGGTASAVRDVTVAAPVPSGPLAFSDSAVGFCYRPASTRSCVFLEEHVLFTSTGGKAVKWTAVSEPWILVRPASGTTPTDVRVSVDMRKLPPVGSSLSVSGLITVSVSGASTSPQTIPVKLQFYAQPLPR